MAATIAACSGGGSNPSAVLPQDGSSQPGAMSPNSPLGTTPASPLVSATSSSASSSTGFTIVQTAQAGATYNSTIAVKLSKAPVAGDVLLLFFETNKTPKFPYSGQTTWPAAASGSQWSYDGSADSTAVLHHVVQSGESGSYTVNVGGSGSGWADYVIAEVAGANPSNPVDSRVTNAVAQGTSSFTFGSAGVQPTASGTFPVAFFTAHQNGLSWSSITSGWTIADRNADFTEMLATGPIQTSAAVNATATLSAKSAYPGAADVVLLIPARSSSGTGPTSAPSAAPTSAPTSAPVSTASYSYQGCNVYGSNDWFTTNLVNGGSSYATNTVDSNSTTIVSYLQSTYGNIEWYSPANETANVFTSGSPTMYPVSGIANDNNPTSNGLNDDSNNSYPWQASFLSEFQSNCTGSADCHTVVMGGPQSARPCVTWESYGTAGNPWSNGTFHANNGYVHNLNRPFNIQYANDGGHISHAGIPMMGTTYWGEDLKYQQAACQPNCAIPHIVGFFMPVNGGSLSGQIAPATQGNPSCSYYCTHTIKDGARFRLRASFSCPPPGTYPQANLVCNSLKQYGMIEDDTQSNFGCTLNSTARGSCMYGLRFGTNSDGSNPWHGNGCCFGNPVPDLDALFAPGQPYYMHISDFELMQGGGA